MKQLKEALIGKHNAEKAGQSLRGLPVYSEYKKKDLKTGDLVIIRWPQLLVFVKKEDANWDDFTIGEMFQSPDRYGDNFCFYEIDADDGTPLFTFLHLDGYSVDLKDENYEEDVDVIKVIPGAIKKRDVKDPKKLAKLLDNYEYLVNELTESLDEALINSRNVDNVSINGERRTPRDLRTGDVVQIRTKEYGIVMDNFDVTLAQYGFATKQKAIVFFDSESYSFSRWSYLVADYYTKRFKYNGHGIDDKHRYDIMRIHTNEVDPKLCNDRESLERYLEAGKLNPKEDRNTIIIESLIGKHNENNASRSYEIAKRKSNLKTGDFVMQRDGDIGVYIEDPDFNEYRLSGDPQPCIIFYYGKARGVNKWQYYMIKYYTDHLQDREYEKEFDVVKIVRGIFPVKDVYNEDKLGVFLSNKDNYMKYFE